MPNTPPGWVEDGHTWRADMGKATVQENTRWEYNGDANLEYGGAFIDLSNWHYGYAEAVRVTDLDSGCGFRGAVMIEHVVINGTDDADRIRKACKSCGWWPTRTGWEQAEDPDKRKRALRHMIADALMNYGFCDVEGERTEIVQMEPDGPMQFGSWRVDKRLHNCDLMGYVKAVHLRD